MVFGFLRKKPNVGKYIAIVFYLLMSSLISFCLLNYNSISPDEVLIHLRFKYRHLHTGLPPGFNRLEQPRHVTSQLTHGLHALSVLTHLVWRIAVHLIPVV